MQTPPREPIGMQPGYVDGGVFYASVRPHQVQTWLQHIPLEPRAARDLAEAGQVMGMDLRTDNVAEQWGIDSKAVISMTWFRPVGLGDLRDSIAKEASTAKPDPFADLTEQKLREKAEAMRAVEEAKRELEARRAELAAEAQQVEAKKTELVDPFASNKDVDAQDRTTIETKRGLETEAQQPAQAKKSELADPFAANNDVDAQIRAETEAKRALEEARRAQRAAEEMTMAKVAIDVPPEPPPTPGDWEEPPPIPEPPTPPPHPLASKAETLAFHSRIHVPVADLAAFKRQLMAIPRDELREAGRELCASFNGELLCYADREVALLLREDTGAVVVDFYVFPARTDDNSKAVGRAEVVRTSRSAAPAQLPVLGNLAGDAVGYLHGPAIAKAHELAEVATAFRRLRWDNHGNAGERFSTAIRNITALEQLRDVRKLFAGVSFEGTVGERDVHMTMRWVPTDEDTKKLSDDLFNRPDVAVGVPTLAGLCDGSVMCMRSTGLPNIQRFGELATGIYGAKEREFSRALNHADEMAALSMFAETWPNAIGAVQRWPAMELEGKPEGGIVLGMIEAAFRVEGAGGSLRSLQFGKRRTIHSDFAAYLRLPRNDANLARTMLAFAELTFSPANVAGVNQKVEAVAIPDSDMPASLYMVSGEPAIKVTRDQKTEEVEFGWLAVADSGDRIGWLLNQKLETKTTPAFYFEIPNLWNLLTSFPDANREINFTRSWLNGQAVKIAVDVVDGAPQIDAAFEKSSVASTQTPPPPPPQLEPVQPPEPELEPPPAT